ncbi:MAG: cation-transporting P-type ATPase [Bifidobacterium tibiigranuli]|jgi:magnesium-transporting ATPase (P-type)|uniref:cation-translocating P-type ATPase n=1 Tax=Bifidobacterium tibiigranuli TaxID=2172043 RepID=UPI0023529742|nr:cation-transporting P-type ATPase [Bifidobacterium tibiigranuli]MCH3973578.1 cation-transporting P-type ATPase [Bifidobacterium tibiigranuli]MCH4189764.1 cation-transporting P-type ATPase [Bifidobacterium tibiigranuli]MCH4204677.1 cation-transporting P-type ATPase [Bifidobacterium tibiigranuli]MCH4275413.1 cation-transporting P-type ATPase [Bifidobacterium tibiigranuli]MCI1791872.1 cation-transporting P-type ATPase [Bifidobacterium tibiigranuli]
MKTLTARASGYSMDEISALDAEDVYQALKTGEDGLSQSQAEILLASHGKNVIEEEKKTPVIFVFLRCFTHLMALLLWAAGAVAFLANMRELGIAVWMVNIINGVFSFWQEYKAGKAAEALRKMLPQYATVIREGQECKVPAEELVPGDVFVLEEGDSISADARLVQCSDLQVNQSTLNGESTPVRKSAAAIDADAAAGQPAAQIPNLVFAGTSVVRGNARAVVVYTGMNTKFGTIARLTQNVEDTGSPLQHELNRLTRQITILAMCIGAVFFTLDVVFVHSQLAVAFIFALGMMVAFIPEGLLPTVTLALAMAVQRMSKRNALVKKLSSVESLGSTSVICTDKTGTLTQNEMTVEYLWTPDREYQVTGGGYAPQGEIRSDGRRWLATDDEGLRRLVTAAALCNDARLGSAVGPVAEPVADGAAASDGEDDSNKTGRNTAKIYADATIKAGVAAGNNDDKTASARRQVYGDPTEACLLVACEKAGLSPEREAKRMQRRRELPFDSQRKRMTVICEDAEGDADNKDDNDSDGAGLVAFTKGAPNEIVALATRVRIGGKDVAMSDEQRAAIMAANDAYADRGLRVLAVACRAVSEQEVLGNDRYSGKSNNRNAATAAANDTTANIPDSAALCTPERIERDLTFLGLEVMADPPRPEVAQAVQTCHRAGIRIIMITGDYGRTALAIARRIGIVRDKHARVVSGTELEAMSDDELTAALRGEIIFARMAPEQKLRIVGCLQDMGDIVAVTGDGVNDAPALKKADVGVAMGITGTDVAKEAADIILTDDNFASIVDAIEEGRAVYANIRRFLLYILNSNVPEAVPSAVYLFSGGLVPLPMTTMQILTIDLGTDMIPALGLGTEPPEDDIMRQPPRNPNERLLNRAIVLKAFFWYGLLGTVASMLGYFFVNMLNGWPGVPLAGLGNDLDPVYVAATTMTLAAIVFAQIGMVWNCRSDTRSVFAIGPFSNKTITIGIVVEIVLILAIINVSILQGVFHTAPLRGAEYLYLVVIPAVVVGLEELRRLIVRRVGANAGTDADASASVSAGVDADGA